MSDKDSNRIHKAVIVGHVDHGKSTLLGQILLATGSVPDDRIASIAKICDSKSARFEPAFLLDALQEEQDQGISIDTTRVRFEFSGRQFLLIDAPGHVEFLKNMTSGASEAELGILVVDCVEGIRSQTERHLKILALLGIANVIVALNKIDIVDYDQDLYEKLCTQIMRSAEEHGVNCLEIVPVSALKGENVTSQSANLTWYVGKPLLQALHDSAVQLSRSTHGDSLPFRMLLQDVYRFGDQRHFVGRILSGELKSGAQLFFSPSGKVSGLKSITKYPLNNLDVAYAGDSVALQLSDQIFVERGEVVSLVDAAPEVDTEFKATIAWLSPDELQEDSPYLIKMGTAEATSRLSVVHHYGSGRVSNGSFVDVIAKIDRPLAFDRSANGVNQFVICSAYETLAAGVVDMRPSPSRKDVRPADNVVAEHGYIEREAHEIQNGHKGTVVWLTGLSGAGKSTLAKALERNLFSEHRHVIVLDGDNLRTGLCADLGFAAEDRSENIRRIAHVARLFLDRGYIVLVACISPYEKDRDLAREIIGADDFNEVFVFCPLEICQQRDPKGLYKKASGGTLKSFSGLDSPYQPPHSPSLRLDSSTMSTAMEVKAVTDLLTSRRVLSPPGGVLTRTFPVLDAV